MKAFKLQFFLLIGIFLWNFESFSQSETFQPKGSFAVDLQVPTRAKNAAFGRTMEGLFNGGVDYRYNVFKGLTVGIGGKYSYFSIQTFALNNLAISGGYHIPAGYLRVGYEKFTNDRVSVGFSVRSGYAGMISANDSCTINNGGPSINSSFFVEPQFEFLLLTDRTSSHGFSGTIGYSFYTHEFSKSELCMDEIPNTTSENFEGITRFLSIGFGYRYYLGRNR